MIKTFHGACRGSAALREASAPGPEQALETNPTPSPRTNASVGVYRKIRILPPWYRHMPAIYWRSASEGPLFGPMRPKLLKQGKFQVSITRTSYDSVSNSLRMNAKSLYTLPKHWRTPRRLRRTAVAFLVTKTHIFPRGIERSKSSETTVVPNTSRSTDPMSSLVRQYDS